MFKYWFCWKKWTIEFIDNAEFAIIPSKITNEYEVTLKFNWGKKKVCIVSNSIDLLILLIKIVIIFKSKNVNDLLVKCDAVSLTEKNTEIGNECSK